MVGLEAKLAPTKREEEQTGSLRKQVKPGWNIDAGRGNMEAKSNPSYTRFQIYSEAFFCFKPSCLDLKRSLRRIFKIILFGIAKIVLK